MTAFMAGIPALKDLYGDLKRRMDHAVAAFQSNLAATRTGRASVHMLDQVKVDYYGTLTPINQMAQVSAPEPQMILISPWDPTALKEIEKAIQDVYKRQLQVLVHGIDRGGAVAVGEAGGMGPVSYTHLSAARTEMRAK